MGDNCMQLLQIYAIGVAVSSTFKEERLFIFKTISFKLQINNFVIYIY